MFDEEGWNDEDAEEALRPTALPPQSRPPQHRAPKGSSQKQSSRLLATLQRLEASSWTEHVQRLKPLSGGSESESEPESQVGRKQPRKRVLRAKAAASPRLAPGVSSSSKAAKAGMEPDSAGKRQRKDSTAEAPGDRDPAPPKALPSQLARGAAGGPVPLLSRKQWRNKQKNKRRQKNKFKVAAVVGAGQGPGAEADVGQGLGAATRAEQGTSEPSVVLRARMEERLHSARFRYINQQLYTSSSQEAARLFQCDPDAFAIYHRGFARQVGRWPENPVQRIIQYLRGRSASLVVADFGCGDAQIARSVRNKVHSFDLVALNPHVTVCDMAKVPLADELVDVAVFCLALMGTNLREILEEANRVLKAGGTLKIAEVASRFADIRAFISAVTQLGFQIVSKDLNNHFFYSLDFEKRGPPRSGEALPGLLLKPCLYKRR